MRTHLFTLSIDLFVHAPGCFLTPIRNVVSEWIVYNLCFVYNVNLCKCTEKQHFRNKCGKALKIQRLRGTGCTRARAVYRKMGHYVNRSRVIGARGTRSKWGSGAHGRGYPSK